MNHVIMVDHEGQQQIYKITLTQEQSLLVGRGWQNDVIINDECIDGSHLSFSIDADEKIVVADLNTRNGTRQKRKKLTGTSAYEVGDNLYLGETVLSLHTVQADVAPAVKQDVAQKASRLFSSFTWVVIATLMAGTSIAGVSYWASSEETTSESLVQGLLGFGIILMAWCAIASFIGKIFRHKTYFKLHWIFACAVGVIGFILVLAFDVLRFNLDTETSNSIIQFVFTALLLAITAYGTLSLSTRMSSGKKFGLTSILVALPFVFDLSSTLLAEDHEKWSPVVSVERVGQPPTLLFRTPVTVDNHIKKTDSLFAILDEEVSSGDTYELHAEYLLNVASEDERILVNID